jgi:hypothetical protein
MIKFESVDGLVICYAREVLRLRGLARVGPPLMDMIRSVRTLELKFVTAGDAMADEPDGGRLPEAVAAYYISGYGYAPVREDSRVQ